MKLSQPGILRTCDWILTATIIILSAACAKEANRTAPSERSRTAAASDTSCVFTGRWDALLSRPGYQVHGITEINSTPDSMPPGYNLNWRRWRGRYDLEWWRLWGPKEGRLHSTSTGPGTEEEIRHGIFVSAARDTISITLSPATSHGPINLWGIWRGDTIRGEWAQRSRRPPPPPGEVDANPTPHGAALLTRSPTVCSKHTA
jgi:hypothetical protein